ncbi:DUF3037 domain-containing protein [Cocleimonas flava]|uniref:DUF3037 family protein n=1 Tax=Cocleimonas flava TaxID=634765 RepID=A0A4R1F7X9_9GAMM|nr:DUF3037 domain-containing protein [Cocleimonas flava]TCJ88812.1 DUF3037 family protein [Cocleimonas flava]
MNKIACQYAIVRFTPFIETGEFANIGIVLISPKLRFFGFNLASKRYGRITQFFKEINTSVYKNTINNLKDELERVSFSLESNPLANNDIDYPINLFHELTRNRETIIKFSKIRTVLTDNPEKELKKLFEYYVERNFITKKYEEELLENKVRQLLNEAELGDYFKNERIGDETYHVPFPFVRHSNNNPQKIIKPLHLAHDDSTKIFNHGAAWIYKINKLKEKRLLVANNVLFAISSPQRDTENRFGAYEEIKQELIETGVQVVPYQDESNDKILDFALR